MSLEATLASTALLGLVYWLIERITPAKSRIRLFLSVFWLAFAMLQIARMTMYWSRFVSLGGQ